MKYGVGIDISKGKTDKKDSLKLAEYAADNWHKLNKVQENDENYDNLRFLSRQYLSTIAVQVKQKKITQICVTYYFQVIINY